MFSAVPDTSITMRAVSLALLSLSCLALVVLGYGGGSGGMMMMPTYGYRYYGGMRPGSGGSGGWGSGGIFGMLIYRKYE